jgi:hypothetical protein
MIPLVLLLLFALALTTGTAMIIFVVRWLRLRQLLQTPFIPPESWRPAFFATPRASYSRRPVCWLAIRCHNLLAVQSGLGLHNPKPCSWTEGLANDEKLFIAPPVNGWTLVIGSGLPDPSDDVDACFRFVLGLSRKFGQVQFFSASRILHHHAWVRAERGRVLRAYAWAGTTVWNQGVRTAAEREMGLKCFEYGDPVERHSLAEPDVIASNVDKVPLLAARWSLDPALLDERLLEHERGISGEPSWRY